MSGGALGNALCSGANGLSGTKSAIGDGERGACWPLMVESAAQVAAGGAVHALSAQIVDHGQDGVVVLLSWGDVVVVVSVRGEVCGAAVWVGDGAVPVVVEVAVLAFADVNGVAEGEEEFGGFGPFKTLGVYCAVGMVDDEKLRNGSGVMSGGVGDDGIEIGAGGDEDAHDSGVSEGDGDFQEGVAAGGVVDIGAGVEEGADGDDVGIGFSDFGEEVGVGGGDVVGTAALSLVGVAGESLLALAGMGG